MSELVVGAPFQDVPPHRRDGSSVKVQPLGFAGAVLTLSSLTVRAVAVDVGDAGADGGDELADEDVGGPQASSLEDLAGGVCVLEKVALTRASHVGRFWAFRFALRPGGLLARLRTEGRHGMPFPRPPRRRLHSPPPTLRLGWGPGPTAALSHHARVLPCGKLLSIGKELILS